MLAPKSLTATLTSFLPTAFQWFVQAAGIAAALLVITQNIHLDFSMKEVKAELHYQGNVLLDLVKEKQK